MIGITVAGIIFREKKIIEKCRPSIRIRPMNIGQKTVLKNG
jgi:hypothetical protein